MDGITWEQFSKDITTIHRISQQLNDGWKLIHVNDDICGKYLVKSEMKVVTNTKNLQNSMEAVDNDFDEESNLSPDPQTVNSSPSQDHNDRLIKFEYHVLYHLSYAVPYLCFNAFHSNGSMLKLDDAWNIFNDPDYQAVNDTNLNMMNILTQMEHPILFKPFLTLHPCRIAEILNYLPKSTNKVLSFLSTYGPSIYLTFDLRYASLCQE